MNDYINKLVRHSPINLSAALAIIIACAAALIGYGVHTGLPICGVVLTIFSDGLLIVYTRVLLFRSRFTAHTLEGVRLYLPWLVADSLILHAITYHDLGPAGFYHLPPLIALLGVIYLLIKLEKWQRSRPD